MLNLPQSSGGEQCLSSPCKTHPRTTQLLPVMAQGCGGTWAVLAQPGHQNHSLKVVPKPWRGTEIPAGTNTRVKQRTEMETQDPSQKVIKTLLDSTPGAFPAVTLLNKQLREEQRLGLPSSLGLPRLWDRLSLLQHHVTGFSPGGRSAQRAASCLVVCRESPTSLPLAAPILLLSLCSPCATVLMNH